MLNQKYGVVYTPDSLADFVAELLYRFSNIGNERQALILDPASGECSLLKAARNLFRSAQKKIIRAFKPRRGYVSPRINKQPRISRRCTS